MTTITIDRKLLEEIVELFDDAISTRYPHEILRDIRTALATPATAPDELERLKAESEERLQNCAALVAENERLRAAPATAPEPSTEVAVGKLCKSLREDLDYAWTWHCNIAMAAFDAGCPHDVANEGAARFMQLLAGVDTREHPAFQGTQDHPMRNDKTAPAQPAWHDAPTCSGLWFCDEGDENPYRFTCHNVSIPLNPHLVGEGERWYGPIPPDGDKP